MFKSIETAPKDGTSIQAEIPGYGTDNIIAWEDGFYDTQGNETGAWRFISGKKEPECWSKGVCWVVNANGEASVKPTKWKAIED